ncbi:MAG: hypothetical protein QNJ15_11075 [Erythrobacter sp.]|nr:hypothetical protein [Erythrobacter sp.]
MAISRAELCIAPDSDASTLVGECNRQVPDVHLALSGERPSDDARSFASGVGLVRSEYVLRKSGNYITTPTGANSLESYLREINDLFEPKPVWVRTSDFEPREIATLAGGERWWGEDENPILGDRGVRFGQANPEPFRAEIAAIVRAQRPNMGLFFSYVADVEALDFAIEVARDEGWSGPLGTMIELPSAALAIDEFMHRPIERVVIGMNDLSSLLLGGARSSSFVSKDHPVVRALVKRIVSVVHDHGKSVFLAGNFCSNEFEALARLGADGLILHHYELPEILPGKIADYRNLDVVPRIKAETAAKLTELGLD